MLTGRGPGGFGRLAEVGLSPGGWGVGHSLWDALSPLHAEDRGSGLGIGRTATAVGNEHKKLYVRKILRTQLVLLP